MYGAVTYAGAPYGGLVPVLATPGMSSGYTAATSASAGYAAAAARSTGGSRRSQ